MKVKELIEELENYGDDVEVIVLEDGIEWIRKLGIDKVDWNDHENCVVIEGSRM